MARLASKEWNQSSESIVSAMPSNTSFQNGYLEKWVLQIWLTLLCQNGTAIQGSETVKVLPMVETELVPSEHCKGMLMSPGTDKRLFWWREESNCSPTETKWFNVRQEQTGEIKLLKDKNLFSTWKDYFSLPQKYYWKVLYLGLSKIKTDVVFSNQPAKPAA